MRFPKCFPLSAEHFAAAPALDEAAVLDAADTHGAEATQVHDFATLGAGYPGSWYAH